MLLEKPSHLGEVSLLYYTYLRRIIASLKGYVPLFMDSPHFGVFSAIFGGVVSL